MQDMSNIGNMQDMSNIGNMQDMSKIRNENRLRPKWHPNMVVNIINAVWSPWRWVGRPLATQHRMHEQVLECRLEYEQETIRQRRWGRSHYAPYFGGENQGDPRRDHLGYYEALGLEPGSVSLTDIKDAFRQAALLWHPDKQKVLGLAVNVSKALIACMAVCLHN